jgi:hypothetical protein
MPTKTQRIDVTIVEDDEEIRANLTDCKVANPLFRLSQSCADGEGPLMDFPD